MYTGLSSVTIMMMCVGMMSTIQAGPAQEVVGWFGGLAQLQPGQASCKTTWGDRGVTSWECDGREVLEQA